MVVNQTAPTLNAQQRGSTALSEATARLVAAHPGWRAYAFEESGAYGVCLDRARGHMSPTVDLPVRFSRPKAAVRLAALINGDRP